MDSLALASQSTSYASNGVAGVAISNDGLSKYLVDENGCYDILPNLRSLFVCG
jgi:hypothetical protein